jgi:hypothetical protein
VDWISGGLRMNVPRILTSQVAVMQRRYLWPEVVEQKG